MRVQVEQLNESYLIQRGELKKYNHDDFVGCVPC